MACGKPIIATNWSGTTEFMNNINSYPLKLDSDTPLVEIENGPFKDHFWANPSIEHLRELMQHVSSNRVEVYEKGVLARETMVTKYSEEVISLIFQNHLERIDQKLYQN